MCRTIVIGGGLTSGFTLTGPFEDMNAAIDFAQRVLDGEPWEVATFDDPDCYTGEPGEIVLMAGNPVDGFEIIGTFDTCLSAANWAGYTNLLAGPMARQHYSTIQLEDPDA